ncbi:unnamed protein product [Calypogeia fissa]
METKEWPLTEDDIIIPVDEVPPTPPRYAIVVTILSAEQPWALEGGPEGKSSTADLIENVEKQLSNNADKTSSARGKAKKGASGEKDIVEKPSTREKDNIAKEAGTPKKTKVGNKDEKSENAFIPNMTKPLAIEEPPLKSKASFSFQFPGQPLPPKEIGPDIGEAIEPELPPAAWVPPPEPTEGDTDLDEPEEPPVEEVLHEPPPPPTTRFVNVPPKEFDVVSNYALWHNLLMEPMTITMYWTSPTGAVRLPFAQAHVDLFPVLALKEGELLASYKLEKIPEPPIPIEIDKQLKPKKGGKGGAKEKMGKNEEKDGKKTKKGKGEPEPPPMETLPALLEGAELKVSLSTTTPFWSEDDIHDSVVMEFDIGMLRNLPPKVVEFGLKFPIDPFNYTLALELPGFFGLDWWDEIKCMTLEEKASIAQVKFEGGKVEVKEVVPEPDKRASIIPPDGTLESELRVIRKAKEAKAIQDAMTWEKLLAIVAKERMERMEAEELKRKLLQSETPYIPSTEKLVDPYTILDRKDPELEPQAVVKWPDHIIVKRFYPSRATQELKGLLKLGHHFRGEIARVAKEITDMSFDKYHGCFFLDLSPFLEEGCFCFELKTPLQSYSLVGTRAGIPLIKPQGPPDVLPSSPSPKAGGKPTSPKAGGKPTSPKAAGKKQQPKSVLMDDDPPLPTSIDPDNPLPNNAWQLSEALFEMKIQASKPIEPLWEPPPEPDISLESVIPPRPKQASMYDVVQMAIDKYSEFVEYVGSDLLDMHQDLTAKELYEETNAMGDPNAPKHRRFETKGEIRKKMVRQLQKQGLWNDIREEMKTKVLKVAAEKYRERKRAANDIGKFEFCNNLYILLSEVTFKTLQKMLEKRKGRKTDVLDNLTRLRHLADEYEAQEDYKEASRCHQERLLGDNLYNPDIWFEYGCFYMRVRPKEQGKAEECWREALTLKKNHLFSLQALGCLMWHCGYLAQAEVLLRNAINLHSEEEHINWVLVSQVYVAQKKKANARNCLKRAETLYRSRQDNQSHYSPPHQLLAPLWNFPFSISNLSLSSHSTGGVFVDTAMLLLDLHLPKEAEQILGLEVEVYACTLDNKWCRARVHELNGKLEKAQKVLKEALKMDKENTTTWLLLGHLKYNYDPPPHYTAALQSTLYKGAIDAFNQYQRFLKDDQNYYKYVYLDLGYSFFKLGEWEEARKVFLKGCTVIPTSPALWLAAGMSYFYAGNLDHAELALVEGNVLDTSNFKIWAFLTLTCLRAERHEEAEVSYQQSLKCIVDPDLLVTIAQGFAAIGNFRDAEGAYLESLKEKEAATPRLELAEMYFKEGKFPFAKQSFEIVAKASDAKQEEKSLAISRLTEMQEDDGPNKPVNSHPKNVNVEI